jgi:predicted NAD/FAD-binding protein
MKIAVIGSGISGLSAAWALRDAHEVVLFEAEGRLGGHSNTVRVDHGGATIDVDTGFIVYNVLNYPNLIALFDALGVATQTSDMSFSVADGRPAGEWGSDGATGFFAWKRNVFDAKHWTVLSDMMRFNARAQKDAGSRDLTGVTLGDYCRELGLSKLFLERYLTPMGAAIWSTPEAEMFDYPAASFVRFFNNHRLLHAERPEWRTVTGGSIRYVEKFAQALGDRVRLNSPVTGVARVAGGVMVSTAGAAPERFDEVILACHSDQALGLLRDADDDERALLGAIRYGANRAVLHRDASFMPTRKAAWASWNVAKGDPEKPVCLTYWMNRLQGIDRAKPLFVTLNPDREPDPDMVFASFDYAHPLFDRPAAAAQRLFPKIQGVRGVWFAGAWQGYGFHEDGLRAGLRVALRLGGRLPWTFVEDDIPRGDWGVREVAPAAAPLVAVGT